MMNPHLIDQLEREGLRFYLDGTGGLRWRHARRLSAEERAAVAANKEKIVAALRESQEDSELELFASILTSIELGREYSRLFPQVANYLGRELTPEHFRILELAYYGAQEEGGK